MTSYFFRDYFGLIPGHTAYMRNAPAVFFEGVSPLMLAYMVSSSFFEETVVRGYVTTELIGLACPVWLATLASILLQTSYHLYYGLAGSIVASAVFVVLALYFARYRRLSPIILGHLFVDLAIFSRIYFHS